MAQPAIEDLSSSGERQTIDDAIDCRSVETYQSRA
jgi:hypothetical protein